MSIYKPLLAVYFIWHPADAESLGPVINHCSSMLHRDINQPFSRAMNLPVFYRTTQEKGIPTDISIQSQNSIFFLFISKHIVADDHWINYIEGLPKGKNIHSIPIALDEHAKNLRGRLDNINFIQAFKYPKKVWNHRFFISIAHEIYRLILNENYDEKKLSTETALSLFISHTKEGRLGLSLAEGIKNSSTILL